jgi:hypothetical protein
VHFRHPLLVAAAFVAPAVLGAQLPLYRRSAPDTIRFREVTTTEAVIQTPGGATPLTSTQRSLVAVAFLPNDSARAWYEELMLEASGSHVTEHPTTTAALRQPFALRVDPRGRVQTLAAPNFPAALNRIADLRHQFDDFFLRLPAAPLRRGLAWSDTLARQDSTPGGGYSRNNSIARYRVERDTVVAGTKGVVIAMDQQVRLVTGGPIEGQPVMAESVLEGTDRGSYVFAPGEGRLLGRVHSGALKGSVTLRGGPQPVVVPQTFSYTSTLEPATVSAAALSVGDAMRRFAIPATALGASCHGVTAAGQPLLLSPTQASKWADIYGVLVGWFGREEMPQPDDVAWVSSASYAAGGSRPAVVAVQFRDSARAGAALQHLTKRAAGRKEWEIARRGAVVTMVNAPAALPSACRTEITGRVARELGR